MKIMERYDFNENEIVTVDLHNMYEDEAKRYLERMLKCLDVSIKEVVVIHGHHSGTKIRDMVRTKLHSKRIERVFLWYNQGRTSLILKEGQ